ncbi:MAG: hypothetical protein ACR2IE_00420 [Candidatus Sumerlaeaceae bacterium]
MLGLYMVIDHSESVTRAVVTMPTWVPFLPVLAPVYVAMLLMTWLLPVVIRDLRRFVRCLLANVVGYLLIMPWWILTPTTLPRPPLPDGAWHDVYRFIVAVDPPNNIFPCAHGIGPIVVAWFVGWERPAWRWPMAVVVVAGLLSIAVVWQHRPVDIVLGAGAAVVGIVVGGTVRFSSAASREA